MSILHLSNWASKKKKVLRVFLFLLFSYVHSYVGDFIYFAIFPGRDVLWCGRFYLLGGREGETVSRRETPSQCRRVDSLASDVVTHPPKPEFLHLLWKIYRKSSSGRCDFQMGYSYSTTLNHVFSDCVMPQGPLKFTMPSFKLKFSLGFITSCYVIFSLCMVQAMDIFMIT